MHKVYNVRDALAWFKGHPKTSGDEVGPSIICVDMSTGLQKEVFKYADAERFYGESAYKFAPEPKEKWSWEHTQTLAIIVFVIFFIVITIVSWVTPSPKREGPDTFHACQELGQCESTGLER